MSIGTRTFVFFNNFYRLNEEEMKMLDKACKFVFTMFLMGFKTEMKKAKSRMARSFHAWVYMNIICQPEKLRRFISYLPTQLQCNFHEGPSFLFEIICNMFVSMVSKATRHLSKSLRRVSSMATASPTNAGNILVDNRGIRYKKEEEISEIQNFLGWAIKELIDDTRMKAIEEKLEGICYDNASLTEKDHCYQFAKSLRILHEEAMTDKEYLVKFYPVFVASYNKGGLCLVAKHIFPFGEALLHKICSYVTKEKLSQGDPRLIKNSHDKILDDIELFDLFLDCAMKGYCYNQIRKMKEMWKKL